MAAKIYAAPEELKQPKISFSVDNFKEDLKNYKAAEAQYREDMRQWLKDNGFTGKNAGEIVRFPWADSYAEYMVISMQPLELFHVPLGDAWDYPDVDLQTPERIQQKIDQQKSMDKLFSQKGG